MCPSVPHDDTYCCCRLIFVVERLSLCCEWRIFHSRVLTLFAMKFAERWYGIGVLVLVVSRLIAARYAIIDDCDEVFNYWEPVHLLVRQT